jgi:hypothetical protein
VTHTTSAMHADTQRGRSLNVSAACRFNSACWCGRSLSRVVGAIEIGSGGAAGAGGIGDAAGATAKTTGGGGGREDRGDEAIAGVPSVPSRGRFAGRGNGVLSTLEREARGSGVVGRESRLAPLGSTLGSGERVAGTRGVRSCLSKANSSVAMGRS